MVRGVNINYLHSDASSSAYMYNFHHFITHICLFSYSSPDRSNERRSSLSLIITHSFMQCHIHIWRLSGPGLLLVHIRHQFFSISPKRMAVYCYSLIIINFQMLVAQQSRLIVHAHAKIDPKSTSNKCKYQVSFKLFVI